MPNATRNISLIGAGNVATHFGLKLFEQGYVIKQVFSRTINNAKVLARKINAENTISDFSEIDLGSDIYIVALPDDTINNLASCLQLKDKLIIHTAGALKTNVLQGVSKRLGVLYPLQTFSKEVETEISKVSLLINAKSERDINIVSVLANDISDDVRIIDDKERLIVHLAAVFACNFTNHMYHIADDILSTKNIDLDILKPLIEATFEKIKKKKPYDVQTGPAFRGDERTMQKHLELLENNIKYAKIYELISSSIKK